MLLIVSTLIAISASVSAQGPPFCKICDCKFDPNNTEVYCGKDISNYLFDASFWIDASTNATYNYNILSVQNSIVPTLDKQFPASGLKILDLANNSIVNVSDNVFSNLQEMEVLVLSENNIEILHPNAFIGLYLEGDFMPLKSLIYLKLDHNKLHSLDGDLFEHTSRIENLTLAFNPFKILDQQTIIAITSLVYLKNLDLSYTGISTLPDYFLHTPKFIDTLRLSGNLLESIPKTLGEAQSLQVLYLDRNPITHLTNTSGFPLIPTLKVLHLCHMEKLSNLSHQSLSNLINLEELYVTDNIALNYIDKAALSDRFNGSVYETWPPIKKLYLQNNKLTTLDMHLLLKWEALNDLDLTDNAWTCECENQWMIDELFPIYAEIDDIRSKALRCAAPVEMKEFTFYDVYEKQSTMRCLDAYGHRPERDGSLLVGILAGVLIAIPLVLFIIYAYQKHWFGIFDNSPASFSRQFYKRTESNDEYF